MIDESGAFSFCGDVLDGAAHVNVYSFKTKFSHTDTHFLEVWWMISPNVGDDRLFILGKGEATADAIFAVRMAVASSVGEFGKEDVRSSSFANDVAEYDVGDIFHWC